MNGKSVSVRELAKATGYSTGEVQRRRARGESDSVIAAAAKRRAGGSKGAKRQAKSETYADAQARKESALADLREMEAAERRGNLLDRQEVKEAVSGMIVAARAKFLMIGDELGDKLASTSDPIRCRNLVDDRICRALQELADYPEK